MPPPRCLLPLDQPGQLDRAGQARRARAHDQHVHLDRLGARRVAEDQSVERKRRLMADGKDRRHDGSWARNGVGPTGQNIHAGLAGRMLRRMDLRKARARPLGLGSVRADRPGRAGGAAAAPGSSAWATRTTPSTGWTRPGFGRWAGWWPAPASRSPLGASVPRTQSHAGNGAAAGTRRSSPAGAYGHFTSSDLWRARAAAGRVHARVEQLDPGADRGVRGAAVFRGQGAGGRAVAGGAVPGVPAVRRDVRRRVL